jgi:hypothetical protein
MKSIINYNRSFNTSFYSFPRLAFANKTPRPEDGQMEKKRHIADEKFTKLVRWEVFPLILLAGAAFAFAKFKP